MKLATGIDEAGCIRSAHPSDADHRLGVGLPMTSARPRSMLGASDVRHGELDTTTRSGSTGEQLLGRLLAPPDLDDGVESLEYWRRRRQQLPWWRVRARREAVRMTIRWEQRVGAALVSRGNQAPLEARLSAGALVARTRLARWTRRARIAVLTTVTTVVLLLAIPAVAALAYLLHAL